MDVVALVISVIALISSVVIGIHQSRSNRRIANIEEQRRGDEKIVELLRSERGLNGWIDMELDGRPGDDTRCLLVSNSHHGHAAYVYLYVADPHINGDGVGVTEPSFPGVKAVHHLGLIPPGARRSVDIAIPNFAVTEFAVIARWTDGSGNKERLSERFST